MLRGTVLYRASRRAHAHARATVALLLLGAAVAQAAVPPGDTAGRETTTPSPIAPLSFTAIVLPPSPTLSPTAAPYVIREPAVTRPVRIALPPKIRTLPPKAVAKRTETAKPVPRRRTRRSGRVAGVATWYCWPNGHPASRCTHGFSAGGAYAAAGPEIRAALGPHYKGKTVWVNGVPVKLIDFCACSGAHVVDVYHSTWITIPNQSHVVVRW